MKPKIYGFNNGRVGRDLFHAQLLAEDGTPLGNHGCSDEAFMPHDLGITPGSRPDRHNRFRQHYPDGYEMEFVSSEDYDTHEGLQQALVRAKEKGYIE